MKFSVLIPTRNRLEYLRYAIYSVVNQDYQDWEVIVYDNFSEEDIQGYIESLNEPRIRYFRTDRFVPVTENWNNALEKSTGDYVIMLGDDDILMKGYFSKISNILVDFPSPDFVYTCGFLYAYPGVLPEAPSGSLRVSRNANFFQNRDNPFWLDPSEAFELVRQNANFKAHFTYNMQYALISRTLIEQFQKRGKFFQSSYPDYYAMIALMLCAKKILAYPLPLVGVGISPKSFGYYYFNGLEDQGDLFLKNSVKDVAIADSGHPFLPGSNMNSYWRIALETVKSNFKDIANLQINYKNYRRLQINSVYKNWIAGKRDSTKKQLWKMMTLQEKSTYGVLYFLVSLLPQMQRIHFRERVMGRISRILYSHGWVYLKTIPGKFFSMQDVFDQVDVEEHSVS